MDIYIQVAFYSKVLDWQRDNRRESAVRLTGERWLIWEQFISLPWGKTKVAAKIPQVSFTYYSASWIHDKKCSNWKQDSCLLFSSWRYFSFRYFVEITPALFQLLSAPTQTGLELVHGAKADQSVWNCEELGFMFIANQKVNE